MKVSWKGDETRVRQVEAFGLTFPEGEAVDVSGLTEAQQRKLLANQYFKPEDDEAVKLKSTPAPVVQKEGSAPQVSELADVWNRLTALESEVAGLKTALGEPAPKPESKAKK